ncbi:MAG: V-type ATP synthase subunit I [Firmicutes bacterium]|nr:V-type ATP synthase subunit I [Bacillota bacterium]
MIVEMSKLTIAGLMQERSAIIRHLMKLGIVHLDKVKLTEQEQNNVLECAKFDSAEARIVEIEDELRKISEAISFLTETASSGKTKSAKRNITFDRFINQETHSGVWEKVFQANGLKKEIEQKKGELAALKNDMLFLKVWESYKLPVELTKTAATQIMTGTIPANASIDELLLNMRETDLVNIILLNSDSDQHYVTITVHNSVSAKIAEELRKYNFSPANFGDIKGTILENIQSVDEKINEIKAEIDDLSKQSVQACANLPDIYGLYDYIYNMQQRRRVLSNFLTTEKAFVVGGWVPARLAEKIKVEIENKFTVFIKVSEPEEGEETPVLLKNNRLIYPFEMITEMYSLPLSSGIDPNAVMAPFYWLFFGLMLGDAVYGILLTVICGLMVWKFKTEKGTMMDKMLRMLALCGISTFIWGALFGSWCGDLPKMLLGKEIPPLWFDPGSDPMRLMIWSFLFGAVHLFAGMAVNAYMLIREGKWLDAIFDIGFWYVTLVGVGLLFLGGSAAAIGKNMAIAGAIGLILTQGRKEKNIIKKISSGILSLYNITGFLSDVLSYSRLLALGLATGVISQVINQLGMMPGGFVSIVAALILIITLLAGHAFNMGINTLGAYVHSSRLQYVEFFGKFYESGGDAFEPLKVKTRYLQIKEG